MKATPTGASCATLLFLLAGCRTTAPAGPPDAVVDLEAIEALHATDAAAALAWDMETLRSLLSPDAVLMPPGEDWQRGAGLEAQYDARAHLDVEVLEYAFDFEDVRVVGDYAFEWGTATGAMRGAGGEVERATLELLRVLQRQPDGSWKVHRAMWNEAGPTP
jgi:ketosteroid isomerase-like protein